MAGLKLFAHQLRCNSVSVNSVVNLSFRWTRRIREDSSLKQASFNCSLAFQPFSCCCSYGFFHQATGNHGFSCEEMFLNFIDQKTLKQRLAELIPQKQEEVKQIRSLYGKKVLGETTVDMVT